MRESILLIAPFVLAGSLWAADPIVGTWKLNTPKSKFSPAILGNRAPLKEAFMTFRELGEQIEIIYRGWENTAGQL